MRRKLFSTFDKYEGIFIDYDVDNQVLNKDNQIKFKYSYFNAEGANKEEKQIVKGWSVQDEEVIIKTSANLPFKVHGQILIGEASSKILSVKELRTGTYSLGGNRFKNQNDKRYIIRIG
jgi:hypothetical protein